MLEVAQSAYLLHSRPYREHQQILDFLTENDGKISAIAYVSNSKRSDKKALLQPLLPLKILLKGQGNLKKLSSVEASGRSYSLTGNHLYSAFYLNELLVRLLAEHIHCQALFYQYQSSLMALSDLEAIEPILRQFELALLDELGVSLDFSPIFSENVSAFHYVEEHGFVPVIGTSTLPKYETKYLKLIAQQELSSPEVLYCFKGLMRQVINNMLGSKPLNSRKLFTK